MLLEMSQSFANAAGMVTTERLVAALHKATATLLAERNSTGFWEGHLSSSALSTATGVTALALAGRGASPYNFESSVEAGLRWLAEHQNADGGWGDTTRSLSNLSTTTLCWAAFGAAGADAKFSRTMNQAEGWLRDHLRNSPNPAPSGNVSGESPSRIDVDELCRAVIARYGKDRTFSVPILTLCALAGRLGQGRKAWRHVIPLPFELAAVPHQWFAALRLPVVSYALPALIAIGLARHVHSPSRNPLARSLRYLTVKKTLRALTAIQPANGGFLEATPLTSFVTMSLAASGYLNHAVTRRGLDFLIASQRPDGSWPIDTNLSTWCTTLAIEALPVAELSTDKSQLTAWLLGQQYRTEHPYTHAAPGGWAWTDLPGGVPDADDTAGALVALAQLWQADGKRPTADIIESAQAGVHWLLGLQNRDGGIPTFCRGWGALPFDRSSADITAHAIRALISWHPMMDAATRLRIERGVSEAFAFLSRTQENHGGFAPLWFGNQFAGDESNRTYGTSRVLKAVALASQTSGFKSSIASLLHNRCIQWLLTAQNADGGWGAEAKVASSVEETALAVESLALAGSSNIPEHAEALQRGIRWLVQAVEAGVWVEPSPIGFYFAKLWYYERLYPLIFTVAALRSAVSAPVTCPPA